MKTTALRRDMEERIYGMDTETIDTDDECTITISSGGESATTTLDGLRRATRALGIRPPDPATFGGPYQDSPELTELADELRGRHGLPSEYRLDVVWKQKGGKARSGRMRLGKAQLASGLLAHYSGADVIVWLAADNCAGLDARQIEAKLFHELVSIDLDAKTLTPMLMPPDFSGFRRELEIYGLWSDDLKRGADVLAQARLAGL